VPPGPECFAHRDAAAYERGRLAGIEEGRAAERADVVARAVMTAKPMLNPEGAAIHAVANDIERGEHVGAAGKVKP
jgi:hypothetical protein